MLDIVFVAIIMAVIGYVLGKAHSDFKHQVEKHFKNINDERTITVDEEKAKDLELKTKK